MPFLLVIGAAYACYANADKQKKVKIDRKINLKGKTAVTLHAFEKEMSILELPIATLSFFQGDYKTAALNLERRCEEILRVNPWLAGWLLPMPDVKIIYDKTGQDRPPGYFTVYEPGIIALQHDTPYEFYSEELKGAIVPGNTLLIGQNKPIWKVAVIPDADEPNTKFAVLVSMSHAVGDAHTYYKIYNMLNMHVAVETLNPVRVANFTAAVHRNLGEAETSFVHDLIGGGSGKNADTEAKAQAAAVIAKLALDTSVSSEEGEEPTEAQSPLLRSFVQHQQETHAKKNVMKMFYVDEEWVLRRKGRRGSVFEADDTASTNATVVSANSILSSWFFRVNQAAVGMLMMNLRHRLPDCNITDSDAGNYVHALVCSEQDFATSVAVQHTTLRLGRMDDESLQFDTHRNASMCVNWATFYREELFVAEDCKQTVHLPIYNTAILQYLPAEVSAINLFTARCAGSNGGGRRAGAFVVCQEAVWKEIQHSGIVADMIADVQ
jgi:hypothetical protein